VEYKKGRKLRQAKRRKIERKVAKAEVKISKKKHIAGKIKIKTGLKQAVKIK
jgi:hypothetical protein